MKKSRGSATREERIDFHTAFFHSCLGNFLPKRFYHLVFAPPSSVKTRSHVQARVFHINLPFAALCDCLRVRPTWLRPAFLGSARQSTSGRTIVAVRT